MLNERPTEERRIRQFQSPVEREHFSWCNEKRVIIIIYLLFTSGLRLRFYQRRRGGQLAGGEADQRPSAECPPRRVRHLRPPTAPTLNPAAAAPAARRSPAAGHHVPSKKCKFFRFGLDLLPSGSVEMRAAHRLRRNVMSSSLWNQENTLRIFIYFWLFIVCLFNSTQHERESRSSIQEGVGVHQHSGLLPQGGRWWPGTACGEQLHRSHLANCRSQIWQDEGMMMRHAVDCCSGGMRSSPFYATEDRGCCAEEGSCP